MSDLSSLRATVAGAGVFGLAIALTLVRRGASVTVVDPALGSTNASAIAAGMLAPALESALDASMAGRFDLLRSARDLWPTFIGDLPGLVLHREGAELRDSPASLESIAETLAEAGAHLERREGAVFTAEDWRIEPSTALALMRAHLQAMGARLVAEAVEAQPATDVTILACGYQATDLAPELIALHPIRGQLLRFEGGPGAGPILRGPLGYLTPSRFGAVVGATMDEHVTDLIPDPGSTDRLLAAAETLCGDLKGRAYRAVVGIRASTQDGLPLVGPSRLPRTWIAAGARRNGWLLAPMVAKVVADGLAGGERTEAAALFASDRFRSTGGEDLTGTEVNPPG